MAEDLDEIEYHHELCDDCDPHLDACRLLANADSVAIVAMGESVRLDQELMLCWGNDRQVTRVRVLGVAWGQPVPEELDVISLYDAWEGRRALVALRKHGVYWTSAASRWVETGVASATVTEQVPLPNRFDDLVDALDSASCNATRLTDAEWEERVFWKCRIGEPPASRFDNGCDYVTDHFLYDCDWESAQAQAVGAACAEEVRALGGDGYTDESGAKVNCYTQVECTVDGVSGAQAACAFEIEPRCQPIADVILDCGAGHSEAYDVSVHYCSDVVAGLGDAAAAAYIQCASALSCDQLISGHSEMECPL